MTSSDVPETIPEHLIPYYLQLELAAELLTDAPEELKKKIYYPGRKFPF